MAKIHLVRHGKTLANEKKLYCGETNLPLSENGGKEIEFFKNQGLYPNADIFFTSGLLRAGQTVDIIYGETDKKAVSDIAEYKFGQFEMKSYEELKEKNEYQAWITDDSGEIQCPNGESKNQFETRVIKGYTQIVNDVSKLGDCSAFVSCHGGVIAIIMEYLIPNLKNFYEWQPKPGRGYTLCYVSERFHIYNNI